MDIPTNLPPIPRLPFGITLTPGLWYLFLILATILLVVLIIKILSSFIKDFSSAMLIFALIAIFVIVAWSLLADSFGINRSVSGFINQLFP